MFSNANSFIIQDGSFINIQGSRLTGLDILQQHVSPDALHDSLGCSPPKCHPNTRIAVLEDILSWVEDDTSETQVLWLHGPAGAGKTAIGHSIVEKCREKKQSAAGFFFSRTGAGRNHDKYLIATISYQLLQSIPEARSFIEAAVIKDPLIFMRSLNSQIRHLIIDPLNQMPHNPCFPRLIVIDGLDECSPEESQTNILMAIHSALKQESFPFRVLICSRAEPNIRDVFESELADSTHKISLDDKYEPDIDIALYLRCKFAEIARKHRRNRGMRSLPLPWPSEKAIKTLVLKASGQFIYAATVIRYVDVRHERPDERLKIVLGLSRSPSDKASNPFVEVDGLYQEIFRAVVDISFTNCLLGALLILKTSLPIDSLENLLGLQPGDAELGLSNLHSVVRMPNDIDDDDASSNHIGLYHASLGDFLFDSQRAGIYHIEMESAHATLAECCLRKISKSISVHSDRVCQWSAREDPAAEYAWNNWIHHFLKLSSWNDQVIQEFKKLPQGILLAWLTRNRRPINEPPTDLRGTIDQFNQLKSWFIGQTDTNHKSDGLILNTLCGDILELYFKNAWADILGDNPRNVSLSLGILAVVLGPGSISTAALATLFKLDWVGFSRATFWIRPYINFNFGASVEVACEAFSDFIANPKKFSEFNPDTPSINAELVIRCVECISSYPSQDKHMWKLDPEGAYEYAEANWTRHFWRASPSRLLDYACLINPRSDCQSLIAHENCYSILCKVNRITRCIESRITEYPDIRYMRSGAKLLKFLKDYSDTTPFSGIYICTSFPKSVSGPSELTSDDHASLVIRYIERIAAYTIEAGLPMRQKKISDVEYQDALLQWKVNLPKADPRRLLNYAYVINVRSGHQPICAHKNEYKYDLFCDVDKITRCIESRIIDGTFFPRTLSAADMVLLTILREIIDIKYLQTSSFIRQVLPLESFFYFTQQHSCRINSQIQSWSRNYRLAIAQTVGKGTYWRHRRQGFRAPPIGPANILKLLATPGTPRSGSHNAQE